MKKATIVMLVLMIGVCAFSALAKAQEKAPGFYIKPVGRKAVKITIIPDQNWDNARRFRVVLQSDGRFTQVHPRSLKTADEIKRFRINQHLLKAEGKINDRPISFVTKIDCGNYLKFRLELDINGDQRLGGKDWLRQKIFWYNYYRYHNYRCYYNHPYLWKFNVKLPFSRLYCC